jgi:hypothetical protein
LANGADSRPAVTGANAPGAALSSAAGCFIGPSGRESRRVGSDAVNRPVYPSAKNP